MFFIHNTSRGLSMAQTDKVFPSEIINKFNL